MYNFHTKNLPATFDDLFVSVKKRHNYNARNASSDSFVSLKLGLIMGNSRFATKDQKSGTTLTFRVTVHLYQFLKQNSLLTLLICISLKK